MSDIKRIAQAAGTSEQTIRLAMQQGCEWGMAVKGSSVYTYIFYPQKVKELFNVEIGSSDGACDNDQSHTGL